MCIICKVTPTVTENYLQNTFSDIQICYLCKIVKYGKFSFKPVKHNGHGAATCIKY